MELCILAPVQYNQWFTHFKSRAEISFLDLYLCSPWKTCCESSSPVLSQPPVLPQPSVLVVESGFHVFFSSGQAFINCASNGKDVSSYI